MSSHPISFTARGWSLRTLGEYDGLYEQLDRESPYPKKHETMLRLIQTAIQEDPITTLGYLPVIKTTKYFLVGYASGIGDKLHDANHRQVAVFFDQSRYLFAPLFLGFILLGCLAELSRASIQPSRTWLMAIPAVFVGIYLLAGETSPRYSFHIQPILSWLAAVGVLSSFRILKKRSHLQKSLKRLGWSLPLIALGAVFLAVGGWALSPTLFGHQGFIDVSENPSSKPGVSPLTTIQQAGTRWNERRVVQLSSSNHQESVRKISLPENSTGHYSFFIWPTSVPPESTLHIDWGSSQQTLNHLHEIRRPQYVEGPTGTFTEITFRYVSEQPSAVKVGYLGFWPESTEAH